MNTETTPKILIGVHLGKNVKRLREILGIKQELLADRLCLSQQTVSRFESQEDLDDEMLNNISKVFNIPVEAIKNYNDDVIVNIIIKTFNEHSVDYQHNIDSINLIMQLLNEKVELYERLLKAEQDKNSLLEKK